MRNRTRFILGCLLALAAAVPAVATAAPRMPVGFQDDPSFRWRSDVATNFNNATQTDASIIRTTSLLGVTGRLQVQEGIVHLIAERVWIPQLSRVVAEVESRDFH